MTYLPFGYLRDDSGSGSSMLPPPVVFEPIPPQKWEYRVITVDLREQPPLDDAQLNELGAEGWLLVGVVTLPARESARLAYHFVRAAA
jgi:hypothetical protein